VIGSLRTWDRTADLERITVPALVTVGGYDEIPLSCAQTLMDGVAGAQLAVFDVSGHMAHEEEPERYAAVVSAFLDDVDESR
jgi:pimeloyl-ACP methyl ester carboxylesterase